jgi:predicted GNAT superfamily acetyltransferase
MPITYREFHTVEDFDRVFQLEQTIWGMDAGEAVPVSMLVSVVGIGGVLIGAEDEGKLVGFTLGMPARREREFFLWSYMAGVAPAYQSKGVGMGLKGAQREWALRQGYSVIRWTFDPMQRPNANFNFNRLGVTADTYHINRYGVMTDELNAGMQSDRLEVTWNLVEERPPTPNLSDALPMLYRHSDGELSVMKFPKLKSEPLMIEIPYDLAQLKRENLAKAREWQLMLRESILWAFERRYIVREFVVREGRAYYILIRQKAVPKPL